VITCAMVESPRLCFDDVSQDPQRLLTGIADSMVAMGSWNKAPGERREAGGFQAPGA
jgi:hypothetical protein